MNNIPSNTPPNKTPDLLQFKIVEDKYKQVGEEKKIVVSSNGGHRFYLCIAGEMNDLGLTKKEITKILKSINKITKIAKVAGIQPDSNLTFSKEAVQETRAEVEIKKFEVTDKKKKQTFSKHFEKIEQKTEKTAANVLQQKLQEEHRAQQQTFFQDIDDNQSFNDDNQSLNDNQNDNDYESIDQYHTPPYSRSITPSSEQTDEDYEEPLTTPTDSRPETPLTKRKVQFAEEDTIPVFDNTLPPTEIYSPINEATENSSAFINELDEKGKKAKDIKTPEEAKELLRSTLQKFSLMATDDKNSDKLKTELKESLNTIFPLIEELESENPDYSNISNKFNKAMDDLTLWVAANSETTERTFLNKGQAKYVETLIDNTKGFASQLVIITALQESKIAELQEEAKSIEEIRESMKNEKVEIETSNLAIDMSPIERTDASGKTQHIFIAQRAAGDLSGYDKGKPFSKKTALDLGLGMLNGLRNLHKWGVHGDLKPDNVLIFEEENGQLSPKLTDFGKAKKMKKNGHMLIGGNPRYAAPEGVFSPKGEVFSVGLMIIGILESKWLMPDQENFKSIEELVKKERDLPKKGTGLKYITKKALQYLLPARLNDALQVTNEQTIIQKRINELILKMMEDTASLKDADNQPLIDLQNFLIKTTTAKRSERLDSETAYKQYASILTNLEGISEDGINSIPKVVSQKTTEASEQPTIENSTEAALQTGIKKSNVGLVQVLLQRVDPPWNEEEVNTFLKLAIVNLFEENINSEEALKVVKAILEKADINFPDENSNTPLHFVASLFASPNITKERADSLIKILENFIDKRAKISNINSDRKTPLAIVNGFDLRTLSPEQINRIKSLLGNESDLSTPSLEAGKLKSLLNDDDDDIYATIDT